jgi:hypothetical protein
MHCREPTQAEAPRPGRSAPTGAARRRGHRINENGIMPIANGDRGIRRLIPPQGSPDRAG